MSTDEITPAQLGVRVGRFRTTKYRSRRTWVEELGRWFASQREADAAVTLRRREQAGEIANLEFQYPFEIMVAGHSVCRYVADFVYVEWDVRAQQWYGVVADAKGFPTPVYRLKKKLMKAVFGIDVQEL